MSESDLAVDLMCSQAIAVPTVVVRDVAAGGLSLLPDFEATGASRFLTEGNYVPWSFVAAGALSLLALRALPVVLVGCLVFRRREVGA